MAALDRIMSLYGVPKELGSDNGPPYQSADLDKFAKYLGYQHNHKIPYAPWANGMAENFMKNLKKLMMICKLEKKNWRQQLQRFLRAYRATPHKSTGFAPATLMFNGRLYRTRMPSMKSQPSAFHEQVQKNDEKAKAAMKRSADDKIYVKESDLRIGDKVLVRQPRLCKTTSPFNPLPYEVIARNGSQLMVRKGSHVMERHVNHCKKWKGDWEVATTRSSSPLEPEEELEMASGVETAPEGEELRPGESQEEPEGQEEQEEDRGGNESPTSTRCLRPRGSLLKPLRFRDSQPSQ
jgi:hypothetical protein